MVILDQSSAWMEFTDPNIFNAIYYSWELELRVCCLGYLWSPRKPRKGTKKYYFCHLIPVLVVYFDQYLLVFCAWNAQGKWFSGPLHKAFIWCGVIYQYLYLQIASNAVFILHLFSIKNQILDKSP